MKIICTKSDLVHAVSIVSKAVSNNTTLPILKCILIEASTGNIKLTANDMELGIETIVDGTILEKGIVAIDAKIFFFVISSKWIVEAPGIVRFPLMTYFRIVSGL